MDIYLKTPGSTLIGVDRITFDDIKTAIDTATNEFLLRPDWDANLRCVELVKPVNNNDVLNEVTLLLRKKLRASQPKVVVITLRLMEALTTNCGNAWFYALNSPLLTKDIANVARKYVTRNGIDNKEVTDTVLDVVQGWGEAFLPKKKQYPNIVDLYFTLRKEGLPFKVNNQFDPNRVPLFEKPGGSSDSKGSDVYLDSQTDAILAATVQESLDFERKRRNSSSSAPAGRSATSTPARSNRGPAITRNSSRPNETPTKRAPPALESLVESITISLTILKELILASTTIFDLKSNEVIGEITEQIHAYQGQVHAAVESSLDNPEFLATLFKYNDYSQTLLSIYSDIKDGSLSLQEGKKVISEALNFDEPSTSNKPGAEAVGGKAPSTGATADLLDYGDITTTPAKSTASKTPVQSNVDLDLFSSPPVASAGRSGTSSAAMPRSTSASSSVTPAAPTPPAPLTKSLSTPVPRIAPPPSGKIPLLAPPPKAGTVLRSNSISEQTPQNIVSSSTQPTASNSSNLLDIFSSEPLVPVNTQPTSSNPPAVQPFAAFPPSSAPQQNYNQPISSNPPPAAQPFAAFPQQSYNQPSSSSNPTPIAQPFATFPPPNGAQQSYNQPPPNYGQPQPFAAFPSQPLQPTGPFPPPVSYNFPPPQGFAPPLQGSYPPTQPVPLQQVQYPAVQPPAQFPPFSTPNTSANNSKPQSDNPFDFLN